MSVDVGAAVVGKARRLGPFAVGFVAIQLFCNLANGGIPNVLIPNRFALLDDANKVILLGVASAIAATPALVAVPLIGMLSDRTRSRLGRRLLWCSRASSG